MRPSLPALVLLLGPTVTWGAETCFIPDLPPERGTLLLQNPDLPADYREILLSWPVSNDPVLNSPFGPRRLGTTRYDWHRGIDLTLPMGTTLIAPADAVVVHAGEHPGFRDTILQLRHNTEEPYFYTLYLHLQEPLVEEGDVVERGDPIALSGQGSASYPHLHWEVRLGCLNQECCEGAYRYLEYVNTPPEPPELVAAGMHRGERALLLYAEVPGDEIDFRSLELQWGQETLRAEVDALNHRTPSGGASKLDDPLFFVEEEATPIVFFPKRFNSVNPPARYELLFHGLAPETSAGTATLIDGGGLVAEAPVQLAPPPLRLGTQPERLVLAPGSDVQVSFALTNDDTQGHAFSARGVSAQSQPLEVRPGTGTVAPGETAVITITSDLEAGWPVDVGDALLLVVELDEGNYTPLLGVAEVETVGDPVDPMWRIQ